MQSARLFYEDEDMKLNENFVIHQTGEETMLIPTAAAPFHGLGEGNETFGVILRCLTKDTTEEEIVDALTVRFQGNREEMAEDVHTVITRLSAIGAIDT